MGRHARDKEGKLVELSAADQEELEVYERAMASDTDEELVLPPTSMTVNLLTEETTIYPSSDFTIVPQHNASSMPSPSTLMHLPRIAAPPGLDSNLMDAAAQSVAQIRGSDFVDPLVLWAPSHQQMLSPEIALFAMDAPRQLHVDDGNNLTIRTADSRLASWTPFQFSQIPPSPRVDNRLDIE